SADDIMDMEPDASENGGRIVFQRSLEGLYKCTPSLTGKYLNGELKVPIPKQRRKPSPKVLRIRNAAKHNLKNIDVEIPLGMMTCITGVSGSGKSTLVHDCLFEAMRAALNGGDPGVDT